jgi:hypothetical protein
MGAANRDAADEKQAATVEDPRRKNYRLRQSKIDRAREILGTRTETETIEQALDLVAFGERLREGVDRMRGRKLVDPDG